jgi:hypothetical protein
MNEKIKEIAKQARAWVNDTNNVPPDAEYLVYSQAYDTKFAELLIKDILYNADMPLIDRNEVRRYYGLEQEPMPVRDIGLVTTTDWTK